MEEPWIIYGDVTCNLGQQKAVYPRSLTCGALPFEFLGASFRTVLSLSHRFHAGHTHSWLVVLIFSCFPEHQKWLVSSLIFFWWLPTSHEFRASNVAQPFPTGRYSNTSAPGTVDLVAEGVVSAPSGGQAIRGGAARCEPGSHWLHWTVGPRATGEARAAGHPATGYTLQGRIPGLLLVLSWSTSHFTHE